MAERPRVALLTREYPPEVYGGAGVHVEHLAPALAELTDVRVHAFGAPRTDPLVARSYEPWTALDGGAPHLAALRTLSVDLAMVAHLEGFDLAHSHTWYANLAGHFAKLIYGVPHVMTTHSLEPLRPWKAEQLGGGYALSSFAERTAIEAADAVIAVSSGMREDILASYPTVDQDRVTVIPNGIDPTVYRPVPQTDALSAHGIDPSQPYVVFVGRITRQKGVVHLLEAAEHLDEDVPLVLCAGAPDTPEIAGEFREHVDHLRRGGHELIWIEEMLPREQVVQLLTHARVFVCPSIYEPFGIVNLEAAACGAPVVATAVGGIPEAVADGETGLLVPFAQGDDPFGSPADPDRFARDLAAGIGELLHDPARARAMGEAGRARVVRHFSWTAVAEQTAALYRRLTAG